MFRADLHCHTTSSDGTMSPVEVVQLAKDVGLSGLSITDHDTIDAYATAVPAAKAAGILLGTGVEFSCTFLEKSVHILGYDFRLDDHDIREFCQKHQTRRIERNRVMIEKLKKHGVLIDEKELEELEGSGKTVGRPHIAALMVKKGYVETMKEAFDKYIGDGKSCYERGPAISVPETIEIIHQADGKAFVAHPHLYKGAKWMRMLLELNFDGLECHYAKFSPDQERPWVRKAREKQLLISGGSDFHGDMKAHINLGCSWVDEVTFHRIFQNLP